MTETMLVRTDSGTWEELRPTTTMPDGGIVDLFGEDIGPVFGSPSSVVVAASRPTLSTGTPDAVCLDADGGIWVVQLALDGQDADILPRLLGFGGALNGMSYDDFQGICGRRGSDKLVDFVGSRVGQASSFHAGTFEVAVADALAHGRFRLVAVVREAAPTLVQSMRFLNSSGAHGLVFEATSFASDSVTAVRAKAVDVGRGGQGVAPTATPAAISEMTAAGFVAVTGKSMGEDTARLFAQMQKACIATFDDVTYAGDTSAATMSAVMNGPQGDAPVLVAGSDGSVVLSFEAVGAFDPGWTVRAELCQGMERLLGADLGDVRNISQLNLTVGEHLMDATLMEALCELLGDTVQSLREATGAPARETTAA